MQDRRGRHGLPTRALPGVFLALGIAVASVAACGNTTPTSAPTGPTGAPSSAGPSEEATAAPGTTPIPATVPPIEPTPFSPPPVSVAPPCEPADLKASHGLVEGAAGSRLTQVVLTSAVTCSVGLYPVLGLRDADGRALVGSPAAGPGRLDLSAGAAYTSEVRVSNWCTLEPAFPVTLEIRLGAEELAVTGGSFPLEGDLPPCNGPTVVNPILEAEAWTPAE